MPCQARSRKGGMESKNKQKCFAACIEKGHGREAGRWGEEMGKDRAKEKCIEKGEGRTERV